MYDVMNTLHQCAVALHHFVLATNDLVTSSHNSVADMYDQFYDMMPAILKFSPVTMIGAGVCAVAALFWLFTRIPEFLIVIGTALVYTAVPIFTMLFCRSQRNRRAALEDEPG